MAEATSQSLMSKWKEAYRTRKAPWDVEALARYGVLFFFVMMISTWFIGVADVLPTIYATSGPETVLLQRLFVSFLFLEMMLNWLCLRYVDSSYQYYMDSSKFSNQGHSKTFQTNGVEESCTVKNSTVLNLADYSPLRDRRTLKPSAMDLSNVASGPNGNKLITYPYWSWSPCFRCDVTRPPRCHHCPLCDKCVLKRDHHCYFAGVCVGWRNQRYFVVFSFWAILTCGYACGHAMYYMCHVMWGDEMSLIDLLIFLSPFRWILGNTTLRVMVYVTVTLCQLYFVYLSIFFLIAVIIHIQKGLTPFEFDKLDRNKVEIVDSRSFPARWRAVMGANWALSFLVPMVNFFPPLEDPVNWPTVSVNRYSNEVETLEGPFGLTRDS